MTAILTYVWIPGRKRRSKEDPMSSKADRSGICGQEGRLIKLGVVSTRVEERNINQTLDIHSCRHNPLQSQRSS
jgi:hypothetical protein